MRDRDERNCRPAPGFGLRALYQQVAEVVEPLAVGHAGEPAATVTQLLGQAWRQAFGVELREPLLSRCAEAIEAREPWSWVLWNDDTRRPDIRRRPRSTSCDQRGRHGGA